MPHFSAAACRPGRPVWLSLTAALVALFLGIAPASAGEFSLAWDGVADPDLGGYRIYYGRASRTYTGFVDVGPMVNRHTLKGLDDCATWFVALKSLDAEGRESAEFSGEVSGFPRPVLAAVSPDLALAGTRVSLTLTGQSLQAGGRLATQATGASVTVAQAPSCDRVEAVLDLTAGAPAEPVDLKWVNPDGVPSLELVQLHVVTDPGPSVVATYPADGSIDVEPALQPRVTFDREVSPDSVTTETVLLLDAGGTPVAQAAGSPQVAGGIATVVPAAPLAQGGLYRLQVIGGTAGVRDLSGNPAVSGFAQSTGFQLGDPPPGTVPDLRRTDTLPPE